MRYTALADTKDTTPALIPFAYPYETEYVSHPARCASCHTGHGILVLPPTFRRLSPAFSDNSIEDWGGVSCVGRKVVFVGNLPIYETITGYVNVYALPQATGEYAEFFLQFLQDPIIEWLKQSLAAYFYAPRTVLEGSCRLGHYRYDMPCGLLFLESLPKSSHVLWMHPYLALEYASTLDLLSPKSVDAFFIRKIIRPDVVGEFRHFSLDAGLSFSQMFEMVKYAAYFPSSSAPPSPSYVYLIRKRHTRVFKIGISNNPEQRLSTLQGANAEALSLIQTWAVPQAIKIERILHRMFDAGRMQGEWFTLSIEQEAELIIYMKQYQDEAYA